MTNPMSNTIAMLSKVMSAAHGELNDDEQRSLAEMIKGAFSGFPVIGSKMVRLADARNWDGLSGALGNFIDVEASSSRQGNVVAQSFSSATSTVNVDMTVVIDVQRTIYESDKVDAETKTTLVNLMREIVDAAQRKNSQEVGSKLREWLGVAADFATVMQVIGPLLLTLGTLLGTLTIDPSPASLSSESLAATKRSAARTSSLLRALWPTSLSCASSPVDGRDSSSTDPSSMPSSAEEPRYCPTPARWEASNPGFLSFLNTSSLSSLNRLSHILSVPTIAGDIS